MTSFVIYTIVLLLLAFLLGAAIGCLFRRRCAASDVSADDYLMSDQEMSSEPAPAIAPSSSMSAAAIEPSPVSKPQVEPERAQLLVADPPPPPPPASEPETAPAPKPAAAKPRSRTAAKSKTPAKAGTTAKAKTAAKTRTTAKTRTAAKSAGPDDLKKLKGVGQKIEGQLHGAGVTRFAQIAKWTKKDIDNFDDVLKFRGRIERDDWVGQAKLLAAGKETEFSKRVKGGDVPTSASKAPSRRGGARKKT